MGEATFHIFLNWLGCKSWSKWYIPFTGSKVSSVSVTCHCKKAIIPFLNIFNVFSGYKKKGPAWKLSVCGEHFHLAGRAAISGSLTNRLLFSAGQRSEKCRFPPPPPSHGSRFFGHKLNVFALRISGKSIWYMDGWHVPEQKAPLGHSNCGARPACPAWPNLVRCCRLRNEDKLWQAHVEKKT